jgi:putative hydrolase of the HAD superfamily
VTKAQLRYGRFKKSFDALGVQLTDDVINKLSDDYINYLPHHNHLFNNTIEVLEYLKGKYSLHIITNGFEKVQIKKLVKSKIDHYFKVVVSSESAGVKKPHNRIFEYALDKANTTPQKSIMIGDTYEADILGAENVGMRTICFNYHKLVIPATNIVINNLLELKDYL